jgi:valyl-tRNA synthetase
VDYPKEIARLKKTLKLTSNQLEQLEKKMSTAGYEEKVPEDLKNQNTEKLEALQKKKADSVEAVANFERLAALESS